ncbi:MAG: hypothetical protein AVDCRST_MAG29-1065 [uncultured Nocardioidaceae bacterium]|uniref:Uncharacterized protein n=1 Tax=uncultured Nocardioidaceae bacterium TaxID=253824 RepID=A0A6J4LG24_9ACTN|nr:MAG: hypothetical protein AVDCRST_MAG29-1065 [uncultured Nocardioidaceae bacterium]
MPALGRELGIGGMACGHGKTSAARRAVRGPHDCTRARPPCHRFDGNRLGQGCRGAHCGRREIRLRPRSRGGASEPRRLRRRASTSGAGDRRLAAALLSLSR